MQTVGRHLPSSLPRGETVAECDYCGVRWFRSQLRRDRSGKLTCPDEGSGLDQVSLDEGNAAAAQRDRLRRPSLGGTYHELSLDDIGHIQPAVALDHTFGYVSSSNPSRKHVGYTPYINDANQLVVHLDGVPQVGDVLLTYIFHGGAPFVAYPPAGEGWVLLMRKTAAPNANNTHEIWGKRWGDAGQTDSSVVYWTSNCGISIAQVTSYRGLRRTGAFFSAVDGTASSPVLSGEGGTMRAPSVTVTGTQSLVVRLFYAFAPGPLGTISAPSDPSILQSRHVYLDGAPVPFANAAVAACTQSTKNAGASGQATALFSVFPASQWFASTVELLRAA
jgi:hypothetical protein